MSQDMERVVAAAKLLKEARALFARVSGAAAPKEQAEGVAKASGEHALVKIAKAKAQRYRLRPMITEVSMVDQPANPDCVVVLRKGAGHPLIELARAKREAAR